MRYFTIFSAAAVIVLGSFTTRSITGKAGLVVTSSSFSNNGMIPKKYSCQGAELSPPLHVSNIPARAQSLALIVHDPDAPKAGGMTHWVAWNLSTDGHIPEAFKGAAQGLNGANEPGYKGMCPPTGVHHYHFRVYALNTRLNISRSTDKAGLEKAISGHILAEGQIVGLYKK